MTMMMTCELQILYNIRPQVVTASDLEGTAYDAKLISSKLARHTTMRHSTNSYCRHWPLVLGLLASSAFLFLRRQRRVLLV